MKCLMDFLDPVAPSLLKWSVDMRSIPIGFQELGFHVSCCPDSVCGISRETRLDC